jgi:hypothetical protein
LVLSQLYLIALPAIAAVYNVTVIGRFLLTTTLVFVSAISILFFMFVPKMYFLSTGKLLFQKSASSPFLEISRPKLDGHVSVKADAAPSEDRISYRRDGQSNSKHNGFTT